MSHKATAWALLQNLPPLQKLVLIILADRHNGDTGRCDPSMDRVAKDCGMSREGVRTAMRELESKGLVETVHRREGLINLPNSYTLNTESVAHAAVEGTQQGGGGVPRDVAQGTPPPGSPLHHAAVEGTQQGGGGVPRPAVPNQELEPVIEPVKETRVVFDKDTPDFVARAFLVESRLAGDKLHIAVRDIAKQEIAEGGVPEDVLRRLVKAWAEYDAAAPNLRYHCKPQTFFEDGKWRNKAQWGWKDNKVPPATTRRYANAR